jgi:GntR family transcriptional regulator, rspAB operon transcriptional repressor
VTLQHFDQGIDVTPYRRNFKIDRKRPAATQVYEDMRMRIISLELEPGTNISRLELVEHYNVSQTPVRDAIILLEKEGLIDVYPQSKSLVTRIDIDHARETQFLRTAFDIEVARQLATKSDKSGLAEAKAILTAQQVAISGDSDLDLFRDLDHRFHWALADAIGQTNLWHLIMSRAGHIDRLRNLHLPDTGKANRILSDHERIMAAIEASDPEDAARAIRGHLTGTLRSAPALMEKYPAYF